MANVWQQLTSKDVWILNTNETECYVYMFCVFFGHLNGKKVLQNVEMTGALCVLTLSRPMFEEDVPSVLELEMEELDQWMKKDSKCL